jgi:hypothetical protein
VTASISRSPRNARVIRRFGMCLHAGQIAEVGRHQCLHDGQRQSVGFFAAITEFYARAVNLL